MFCIDAEPSNPEELNNGSDKECPKYQTITDQPEDSSDSSDCETPTFSISAFKKFGSDPVKRKFKKRNDVSSSLNAGEDYNTTTYINMFKLKKDVGKPTQQQKDKRQEILDKNLEKSIVCQPGFEKLEELPPILSFYQRKKLSAKEREKTKGYDWYGMPAPEMTEEKKNDLMVVQMRQALDPKHFYKRSATKETPKYFQVGTFVDNPIDFYSSRVPKKQRKQTIVDELLADAEFRQYQKKKFNEIQRAQPPKYVHRKKLSHRRRNEAKEAQASKKSKKGKKKA